jgi:hypothetical protein
VQRAPTGTREGPCGILSDQIAAGSAGALRLTYAEIMVARAERANPLAESRPRNRPQGVGHPWESQVTWTSGGVRSARARPSWCGIGGA